MAWLDAYKTERILVQQESNHNKFWSAVVDDKTNIVTIRWGRLGTKGQNQVKPFGSSYEARSFMDSKFQEKRRKGYQQIEKPKFDKLSVEAAIVGTKNKCSHLQWVEITDERHLDFKPCDETRLQDPNCNPGIRVDVETKKSYGGKNRFNLLFTFTQAFDMTAGGGSHHAVLITKTSPLYELTGKVEEAIGRTLST